MLPDFRLITGLFIRMLWVPCYMTWYSRQITLPSISPQIFLILNAWTTTIRNLLICDIGLLPIWWQIGSGISIIFRMLSWGFNFFSFSIQEFKLFGFNYPNPAEFWRSIRRKVYNNSVMVWNHDLRIFNTQFSFWYIW